MITLGEISDAFGRPATVRSRPTGYANIIIIIIHIYEYSSYISVVLYILRKYEFFNIKNT